jgi:hypothetical protein
MKILTLILGPAIFLSLPLMANTQSVPNFPMSFWGTAKVDGSPAPSGSVIRAYYGTTLAGQVVLSESGVYGYTEPTKQKLVVGQGSGEITFTIQSPSINSGRETGGASPQTYSGFTSGLSVQLNLQFTTPVLAQSSTGDGGGGSGSGSGGGATLASGSSNEASSKAADVNGDGKVGIMDFNLLMVNWGDNPANPNTDLNGDGRVDIFDFNILMVSWSK